jgi:putative transposase
MARLPRLALAGHLHLVQLQGHNGQAVFADDHDRASYLDMVREAASGLSVAVHAFCLLEQELRLLLTPQQADAIGRMMQALGRRYVSHFNRRHGRTGTLWNGRFRSALLQAETWLLPATLALELLPVRAGLAGTAEDWLWSSASHHTGRLHWPMITEHPAYWKLGNTPFERELAHANLLREGVAAASIEALEQALRGARIVGDAIFCAEVAQELGRSTTQRPRGRPARANTPAASDGL